HPDLPRPGTAPRPPRPAPDLTDAPGTVWAMTIAHPIATAWLSTGTTGAQNYDEFADDAEITQIIAANPASALAVEMPHLAPGSAGKSFLDALPDAVQRLADERAGGGYTEAEQVVVLYRITGPGEPPAYGLWAMV